MNISLILLNVAGPSRDAADVFVKQDPYGVVMAVISMVTVLLVLAIAAFAFQNIDTVIQFWGKLFTKKAKTQEEANTQEKTMSSGEDIAAIALAMYLYKNELHDNESLTLTMNKISRTYSPWSSKIYGIMNRTVLRNPYSK
ncbi:MAG: OadG family protein [Bacteroidales bacterium]|jgi:Na+-transporting methylmalonyl-CoA/oxaloacetate decarboxylase gamma subunit|nr:OadG family protein [Bacteroidales bacterium]MDD4385415.1 OadG family protein [Bacteroidales bacterium]MDY0198754.1 OadG family protein [Tenuifilaceae bacterium]